MTSSYISWQTVFRPEFTTGGIDALTRGINARLFEDFEGYASNAALQAVWTLSGGGGGDNVVRTSQANALHGDLSAEVTLTGGPAALTRTISNNFFYYPAGRRIRYVAFRATLVSGTGSAIRVRLGNAANTIYREWAFTLDASVTRDMFIDLYSASAGYQNTESNPGPVATAGTWDPLSINTFSFRSLSSGSVYRFDDIRFYYEYSLLDAIGFGTEPVTDDGVDGSIHSKLRYLNNIVLQLVGTTDQYSKYGPSLVFLNNAYTFGLELKGMAEQGIPTTTEITPGNYTIDRIRDGTTTNIVASTGATEATGFISASYTPLEDNWIPGDQLLVTFSGGRVDADTDTAVTPSANIGLGATTIALTNAAVFQAGQRIRIYDDLTSEWNSVISVDSPIQITVTATANAYTSANNFRIILAERTDLETARFSANIAFEELDDEHLQRWVLADYDDFTQADADGNTERWDTGYIANSDGSAAGAEGGTADINTSVAGQLRVRVDPDATPTRSAYAVKRDEPSQSRFYTVSVDLDFTPDTTQVSSVFAGLRISAGDVDDAANYILVARESSSTVNRITAHAEFNNVAQTDANFNTTDNAVAFKIERYGNVWNVFYSLVQYPNWQWVKLTQFEDANGDMTNTTSTYLYAESGGTVDAQVATGDFDNYKYYIGSGAIDQLLLASGVIGSGTFTTSSTTVPADTGRTEGNDYWNGVLIMPVTGVAAFQPRSIVDFANAGGVFTIDSGNPFTVAPAVGDEYWLLAFQYPLVPGSNATFNQTAAHVVGDKADSADWTHTATNNSLMRLVKGILAEQVIAEGAFTTSSATVPADTGRAEADDYWNGSWLMPVVGAIAYQPRLITDFTNVGGVFTLDAQQPFTAVPGTVAYVILSPNSQLAPAVDATTNTTPAHVIGSKTDTADYTPGATASSLVRLLKGLLGVTVIAEGTLTTSSATVPADTGRAEANDYWNGSWLMTVTGAVAFQPRLIVGYANAGGVFTLDAQNPFTAAPGTVAYVILAPNFPLQPAADATTNTTTPHTVGNKADTASYSRNSANSLMRYLKALHTIKILTNGTFTTSSATVPADTGRTEGDNYWNGSWLIPLTGAVALQPRLITGFANAGGVFTVDAQQPFTAATGTVTYVVVGPNSQLVPAADATTNTTPAHVTGNKADAIPAMNLAPGADSAIAHLKAILERVGATPADPDDSVLTNIGQRDDTATLDTLGDITTTSIQAKLRRLLLRFSADAFAATVQGVSRTDIENMVQGLANYLSSAGAAWSVTANPGAAAKDNLEQTLEDFADMVAGTTGIVTFPAGAVAANGVSLAEVLRYVMEAVGSDDANNAFASTNVVENGDGSVIERVEELRGRTATGTFTRTNAHGTTEQTVTDISPIRHGRIAVEFDINTLIAAVEGGTVTFRLLNMIDGATLRIIDSVSFIVGTDEVHPTVSGWVQEGTTTARVTMQVNSAVSVNRDVPWRIVEAS